jgi:hypothetical protein
MSILDTRATLTSMVAGPSGFDSIGGVGTSVTYSGKGFFSGYDLLLEGAFLERQTTC